MIWTEPFAAQGVACARGGRLLFEDLGLALAPGDLLVVRGANGSGKSSLLRLMAGLAPAQAGVFLWGGQNTAADLPQHRARLHLLAHADGLKGLLTVAENLAFATALLGGTGDRAALDAFDLAALADRPVRFLSSGQRRRAALARLVAVPRPLWLLDEPENGLDRANRRHLVTALDRHRGRGGIAVLVTHVDLDLGPSLTLEIDT